ncbi:MAG TPA: MarR family transcriptional regulator [Microbacteriaceae bacterium]|nr:MarR family transcriptional regulator [Microbacteriaceae bacterium]
MKESTIMVQSTSPSAASNALSAWEALFRAQVRVLRVLHAEFPDDVLTLNEYDVLFTVARERERSIRMRDLNRNVLLSQSSVSRMVDRLTQRGFVAKRPDPHDGRGAIVELTERGTAAFERVAREHARSIRAHVGTALSADDMAALERICSILIEAMPDVAPHASRGGNAAD